MRLLRIMRTLLDEGCPVELILVGDGEERQQYERFIAEHALSGRVHLLGALRNPYAAFVGCDLFVCFSLVEGYSLVISEALVLGVPVISTRVLPEPEGFRDGLCVFTQNSDQALLSGMRELLSAPDRLSELRRRILAARHQFSLKAHMAAVEDVLDGRF